MATRIRTTDPTPQKNNSTDTENEINNEISEAQPVTPRKQSGKKNVTMIRRETFVEDVNTTSTNATTSDHLDPTEYEDDDESDVDVEDFQDMFSNAGDGEKLLIVKKCPGLAWVSPSTATYCSEYPYDKVGWAKNIQNDYPDGGNFWLGLKYASGPLAGKFAVHHRPWQKWPMAPVPLSQRRPQAPPLNFSGPTHSNDPAEAIKASLAPLTAVLGVLRDMGLTSPANAVAVQPPKSDMDVLAMDLLRKKIMEDPQPRPVSEKATTMADALIEVGVAFAENNPGIGTELLGLAKAVLPRLIFPQSAQQQTQQQNPHYDAEAEAISEHADTIDVPNETQQTEPPPQMPFNQAYDIALTFTVNEMLESKPVEASAAKLLDLHSRYPDGYAEINGFTLSMAQIWPVLLDTPPDQLKAMLMQGNPNEEIKRRLAQSTTAEQWISQLQKNLKIQK